MKQGPGLRLDMRRDLSAPPSRVFRALTEPGELARWWGPDGFQIPSIESDLRPGGGYRIAMQPPDGALFYLAGEFRELDPPRLVSYTFRWEDPNPEDRETLVTLSLREIGGGSTELALDQGDFATERRRALHEQGWTQSLNHLEQLMAAPTSP
ncbi:MAG: SRPBCC domain-containing protein [Gaiellales bacterium]